MRIERGLAAAAALMLAAPGADHGPGRMIWIDLCDGAHPGRRIPLPTDRGRSPPKACHASCGTLPQRRLAMRRA